MAFTADHYLATLKALMPPGRAHDLGPTSKWTKSLHAIADELARVDERGIALIDESDPRTATETIEDWERILGLPDDLITEIPVTIEQRRVVITQRMVAQGGQNPSYFFALGEACGWPLESITLSTMCRVGHRIGVRLYGDAYQFSMLVTAYPPSADALDQQAFERTIRHATHAHIVVEFTYL